MQAVGGRGCSARLHHRLPAGHAHVRAQVCLLLGHRGDARGGQAVFRQARWQQSGPAYGCRDSPRSAARGQGRHQRRAAAVDGGNCHQPELFAAGGWISHCLWGLAGREQMPCTSASRGISPCVGVCRLEQVNQLLLLMFFRQVLCIGGCCLANMLGCSTCKSIELFTGSWMLWPHRELPLTCSGACNAGPAQHHKQEVSRAQPLQGRGA